MPSLSKMLVIANTDWFLAHFMSGFLTAHVRTGVEVHAASPPGAYVGQLRDCGVHWSPVPISRGRGSLGSNIAAVASIRRLEQETRPDLVHFVTAKAVALGNLALIGRAGLRVINVLPGLGHAFSSPGVQASIDRRILQWGVSWSAARPLSITVFHQTADEDRMLAPGTRGRGRTRVIPGWGIDMERFSQEHRPTDPPLVVLVSRMLWSKGIAEFVELASRNRGAAPARYVMVGEPDMGNPAPVPTRQLEEWDRSGVVEWWGHRRDIPEVLAKATVFVFPSRYGEGVPQALIEAAAMGIPIVASDLPGCREVVESGVNGWLVPPGDVARLAEAILDLLRDPEKRRRMGAKGRETAQQRFAIDGVVRAYAALYREMGLTWSAAG